MTPSAGVSLIPLMYYNNRRLGRLLILVLALTVEPYPNDPFFATLFTIVLLDVTADRF